MDAGVDLLQLARNLPSSAGTGFPLLTYTRIHTHTHMHKSPQVDPGVDLLQLARDLPGLAGADLANIVNEAQLNAVRGGRQAITAKDMYAGVDRFTQVCVCVCVCVCVEGGGRVGEVALCMGVSLGWAGMQALADSLRCGRLGDFEKVNVPYVRASYFRDVCEQILRGVKEFYP